MYIYSYYTSTYKVHNSYYRYKEPTELAVITIIYSTSFIIYKLINWFVNLFKIRLNKYWLKQHISMMD